MTTIPLWDSWGSENLLRICLTHYAGWRRSWVCGQYVDFLHVVHDVYHIRICQTFGSSKQQHTSQIYSMKFAGNLRTHKPWLVRLLSLTSCVGCLGSCRNSCPHPSVVRFHICHPPVMQCCTSVAIVVWYFDALHECDGTVQLQCLCAHLSCVCHLSACLCVCLYRVCLQSRQPGRFHIHWY